MTRCLTCGTRLARDSIAAGYQRCATCAPTVPRNACRNGHPITGTTTPRECPRCVRMRAVRAAVRRGLT